MATAEERIADLERQLTDLRRDFAATKFCLAAAFAAGSASVTGSHLRPGNRAASRLLRGSHLRAVDGDAR